MLRAVRAGFALCVVFVAFACGDDNSGTTPVENDGGVKPPTVPPPKPCEKDTDCKENGKCKDVGSTSKMCVYAKSCTGGDGADNKCGGDEAAVGSMDCCATRALPGGTYSRFNNTRFPATVSPFMLDVFEVTAGRFRAYVDANNGNLRAAAPAAGAGAHPKIKNSGWRTEWNKYLPSSRAEVDKMLGPDDGQAGSFPGCQVGTDLENYGALTWWTEKVEAAVKQRNASNQTVLAENTKQALDRKPINCVSWHVLFAFCVWDGGRLPTDAEWGFAVSGGDNRNFPWGEVPQKDLVNIGNNNSLSFVPTYAAGASKMVTALWEPARGPNEFPNNWDVHTWGGKRGGKYDNAAHIAPVGRRPQGNGKWGHADLAGGMFEWMLDEGPIRPGNCVDCANVNWPANDQFDKDAVEGPADFEHRWFAGGARSARGGAWDNSLGLATKQTDTEIEWYTSYPLQRTYRSLGGRCARDL